MVAKKKKTSSPTHIVESTATKESSEKEERRAPITQVVEVVEETEEQPLEKQVEETTPSKTEEAEPQVQTTPEEDTYETSGEEISSDEAEPEPEKRKEMVEELFQSRRRPVAVMPELSGHAKRSRKPIVLWAIIVLVIALAVGIGLWLFTTKSVILPSITLEPTPTPTETPAPSPTPEPPARGDVTIEVLNGGGVSGAASKMKKILEEKGYTVAKTGNTKEYTYDKTEILVKPGKESILSLLEEDLKGEYSLGATGATLEEDSKYDVRVIVGKE